MKKYIGGPSPNVMTSKCRDVEVVLRATFHQLTLRRRRDSISEIFLDITKRTRKERRRMNEIRDGDDYIGVDREIVSTPVFVFSFFLKHLMINNSKILKNNMIFKFYF